MQKMKAMIKYEQATKLIPIGIFYAIQYGIVLFIALMVALGTGSLKHFGSNLLEINTFVFVGVVGVLGFKEDFKMFIQHGFTRKYIFGAVMASFAFVSAVMALVDTAVGQGLHGILPKMVPSEYASMFGTLYGYDSIFSNWLWLFTVYMLICSLLYLIILIIHKVGKKTAIVCGVGVGAFLLVVIALFRYVLPEGFVSKFLTVLTKMMGFEKGLGFPGNPLYPIVTFAVLLCIISGISFIILKKTEIRN